MPCTVYESPEEIAAREKRAQEELVRIVLDKASAINGQELNETKANLNKVTRLLCGLMKQIESGKKIKISKSLQSWWNDHKIRDSMRKK